MTQHSADKSQKAKEDLDKFFRELTELGNWYKEFTGAPPKSLVINPDIVARLSRIEGFYQREELAGKVTASSPIVRYFKLGFGMVMLVDDWEIKFLHFDD